MVDLHLHSKASDGTDDPCEILRKALRLKLKLCSVTDHDTVDGQSECIRYAKEKNVPYITGIELSAKYKSELHILGYGIDICNSNLVKTLGELRESRLNRAMDIVSKLNKQGKKVRFEEVQQLAGNSAIGRPHIAQVMMNKGYVGSIEEAFNIYLNDSGSCYAERKKLKPEEAVSLIRGAGGYPVIAHPKFVRDLDSFIRGAYEMGFWGIETYYPAHKDSDIDLYLDYAKRFKLYVTSGSDYHGFIKKKTAFASEKRSGEYLEESINILLKKKV